MAFTVTKRISGFSLIEILVALALGSIAGTAILATMVWQTRQTLAQSEANDVHQRARTIINFLQAQGSSTGFGYPRDPNSGGMPATGVCSTFSDPTVPSATGYPGSYTYSYSGYQNNCTGLDLSGSSDRLRLTYLDPWLFYFSGQTKATNVNCANGTVSTPVDFYYQGTIYLNLWEGLFLSPYTNRSSLPLATASIGFLGGFCVRMPDYQAVGGGTSSYVSNANGQLNSWAGPVRIHTNTGSSQNCNATYRANALFGSYGVGCYAYQPGYMFGAGEMLDVWCATEPNNTVTSLYVRQFSWGPTVSLLARYVSKFQVVYGMDLSSSLDGQIDPCPSCTDDPYASSLGTSFAWCRDPRATDTGGACNLSDDLGNALSTVSLHHRIIALYVTFTLRSATKTGAAFAPSQDANGFGQWTYSTLVNLKALREHS